MAKVSKNRKIVNYVLLGGLLVGAGVVGAKLSGQIAEAKGLAKLEEQIAATGMPRSASKIKERFRKDENAQKAIAELGKKIETEPNYGSDLQKARYDANLAWSIMTERQDFASWADTVAKAPPQDYGLNLDDFEFGLGAHQGAIYYLAQTPAHAAKKAALDGNWEEARKYRDLSMDILGKLSQETWRGSASVQANGMNTAYRYVLEVLDTKRNDPEALKFAQEAFAQEVPLITYSDLALTELFRVRVKARDVGRDASLYHMNVLNWVRDDAAENEAYSDLDEADVNIWRSLPSGVALADIVEMQVIKDLQPLADKLKAANNNPAEMRRVAREFEEALPKEPKEDITGITPRIYALNLSDFEAMMEMDGRRYLGRQVLKIMEEYQKTKAFPAEFKAEGEPPFGMEFRYVKTLDGFQVNLGGRRGGYQLAFPMIVITPQMERPAVGAG